MLTSYLKIALRNLRQHRAYYAINLLGLTLGVASFLLILLFVYQELSYDRHHERADRIYRVASEAVTGGKVLRMATTPTPAAPRLQADFPEVQEAARIWFSLPEVEVERDGERFFEKRVFWADSSALRIFTFPFVRGNPATALSQPNSLVLTESTARKYFGSADPIGKTLTFNGRKEYHVTGVVEDVPPNSHFEFDFLGSFSSLKMSQSEEWLSFNLYTYVLLPEGGDPQALQAKLPGFVEKYIGANLREFGIAYTPFLQPLTDIHLHSDLEFEMKPNGNAAYVYIFSALALLVLLIAGVNYTNLAIAQSARRAKEVGVRKVLGAERPQLVRQFLGESLLLALIATLLAVLLVQLALPLFNSISGLALTLGDLGVPVLAAGLLGTVLVVGIASGVYPALYLSGFQPVRVLKGRAPSGASHAFLRKGVVVFQFAIAVFLIVGTGVMAAQLSFIQNKELGFDKEQVVVVPLQDPALLGRHEELRTALRRDPNIVDAAAADHFPGGPSNVLGYTPEGSTQSEPQAITSFAVDFGYVETLGMKLAGGRAFSREFGTDREAAVVINEAAARRFGWSDPVGKRITRMDETGSQATVVGVVEDFHFESLHQPVQPMVMQLGDTLQYLLLRVRPDGVPGALDALREVWRRFSPGTTLEYSFLDERFGELHRDDERLAKVFAVFALLTILISALGLFAMVSFSTEQRTKEIGVRKVFGASAADVVRLMLRDFVVLVVVAIVIAWPLSYYAVGRWLQDFEYRTEIPLWIFAATGVLVLLIASLTVAARAARAAMTNPVRTLRYE
ncbi:MAG TPA: ABC transporter permease [Longimicrobiaceae bacterium]|nr:ABC transporter permease [Longimicrobiaceae bacterium]